ncbi:MAG: hypothetical protein AAF609_16300 [Cyanobacteria bacterium P01_C01_bin.120]
MSKVEFQQGDLLRDESSAVLAAFRIDTDQANAVPFYGYSRGDLMRGETAALFLRSYNA